MHVKEHDEKTDDHAESDHAARKWFQLRKIRGSHERHIFGGGAHTVQGSEVDNLRTSGGCVAFAADIKHRDALFGAGDVLRGLERDKVACAFSVGDDAADGKAMIQKNNLLSDLQVFGLCDDVIGDGFIRGFEWTPCAEQKSAAESIKALVIDAINEPEVFRLREDKSGSDFIDAGKRRDFVAQGFLHDGAGESEENRRVGRLHEKIGADALDAFSPFGKNSRRETHNEKNQNDLDGDGNHAEKAAQRPGNHIAPHHLQKRESSVEGIIHRQSEESL